VARNPQNQSVRSGRLHAQAESGFGLQLQIKNY